MRFIFLAFALALSSLIHAQAPALIPYQAIARDANGQPISNSILNARFTLHDSTANGIIVWQEIQTVTTSALGLFTSQLGLNVPLALVNWGIGDKFLKVELDLGDGFIDIGTQQMLSVPYALFASYANTANSAGNGVPSGGINGQLLTYCNGVPTWTTNGQCPGTIANLYCSEAVNTGALTLGQVASNVSSSIAYSGGNGGVYSGQSVASTGVTGLTASLNPGNFSNDSGSLVYTISGTPSTSGTAFFNLNVGGQSCLLSREVNVFEGTIVSLFCSSEATVVALDSVNGLILPISYSGGNGGSYSAQTVTSSGINGLTASISAGAFNTGFGTIQVTICGQPSGLGVASFNVSLGGRTCTLSLNLVPMGSAATCGAPLVHNPMLTYGSLIDHEGNEYKTITIGGREWMAENLKCDTYRNGDSINHVTDQINWSNSVSGVWCYYDNNSQNNCPYGKLYNWYACVDSRGLCPTGWHIPAYFEWSAIPFGGEALKSTGAIESGTGLWHGTIFGGNNNSGFSGIPGGNRSTNGDFGGFGYTGNYWSSSTAGPVYSLILSWNDNLVFLFDNSVETEGLSVRCVRD